MATKMMPYAAILPALRADAATETRARAFVAEIRGNVDAWYCKKNTPETYAAFTATNGATWKRIAAAGKAVHDEVLRILREEPREPE